jgi:N utilization substance protein B
MPDRNRDGPKRSPAAARSAARLAAVQALYQMDIAGTGVDTIMMEYETHRLGQELDGATYAKADVTFFRDLISGVVREQRRLDPLIDETLREGWPLTRIDSILRAVFRAGTYELKERHDVPSRVVINEYLDVVNAFFEQEERRVANGVLDALARQLRPEEMAAPGSAA